MKYIQYFSHPLIGNQAVQKEATEVTEEALYKLIAKYVLGGWQADTALMRTNDWDEIRFRKDSWLISLVIDWEIAEESEDEFRKA